MADRVPFRLGLRGRLIRDAAVLLLSLLLILALFRAFWFPTAGLALRATGDRWLFQTDEVVSALDLPGEGRVYLIRSGRQYACAWVERAGPFWRSGALAPLDCGPDNPPPVLLSGSDGAFLRTASGDLPLDSLLPR